MDAPLERVRRGRIRHHRVDRSTRRRRPTPASAAWDAPVGDEAIFDRQKVLFVDRKVGYTEFVAKIGRPKIAGHKQRRIILSIRVTPAEKRMLAAIAKTRGGSFAEWARKALLRAAAGE